MPLKGQAKPGPIGLHCIGGVIEHLPRADRASAARPSTPTAGCGTPGFWAPVYADWGYQNRTCALRISAPGRFEYRAVDAHGEPVPDGRARC